MHLIYKDVNHAFKSMVEMIQSQPELMEESTSRYGDVLRFKQPVMVSFLEPKSRVLMNRYRDVNPFFHMFEAMWMLAGCCNVQSLTYFNKRMAEFSDNGITFNGAYGYRWRYPDNTPEYDQIPILVKHLKEKPDSRRAVLQMWTVTDDLLKVETSKDVCCNLSVCFKRRKTVNDFDTLDMTVFNRSNDMIWGMLGANVVHFSYLHEYMANMIGVHVGTYNQITNDLHVYKNVWDPVAWSKDYTRLYSSYRMDLVKDKETFDEELWILIDEHVRISTDPERDIDQVYDQTYHNPYLTEVVDPVLKTYHYHKRGNYKKAIAECDRIAAYDWKTRCQDWINKRWKEKSRYES